MTNFLSLLILILKYTLRLFIITESVSRIVHSHLENSDALLKPRPLDFGTGLPVHIDHLVSIFDNNHLLKTVFLIQDNLINFNYREL